MPNEEKERDGQAFRHVIRALSGGRVQLCSERSWPQSYEGCRPHRVGECRHTGREKVSRGSVLGSRAVGSLDDVRAKGVVVGFTANRSDVLISEEQRQGCRA